MFEFFSKKRKKEVTIATSCWEKDWRYVLQGKSLQENIEKHQFAFSERLLVINNVLNQEEVWKKAEELEKKQILTKIVSSQKKEKEVLSFFSLTKEEFLANDTREEYQVDNEWIFYNSLAPLTAIYFCKTPYLLYFTPDAYLKKPLSWIEKALFLLEKDKTYKVANPLWNERKREAKKESLQKKRGFWVSKEGFSDQMFLVKTEDFQKPIYSEVGECTKKFPRGEVFEKRVYIHLKNQGYKRLIFSKGSYYHT